MLIDFREERKERDRDKDRDGERERETERQTERETSIWERIIDWLPPGGSLPWDHPCPTGDGTHNQNMCPDQE